MSAASSIRVLPELRSIQVERAEVLTPALHLYFAENYDLSRTSVPKSFRRVGLIGAVAVLARSRAVTLELPEPLWLREFPRTATMALVWRLRGLLSASRREVVMYAIENNDLETLVGKRSRVAHVLVVTALRIFISHFVDRIAFGSPSAASAYSALISGDVDGDGGVVESTKYAQFTELPAPRNSIDLDTSSTDAIFVGELSVRKGMEHLMAAWELVERQSPGARLRVVGTGPLTEKVVAWCSASPQTRHYMGFVEHGALDAHIEQCAVLVAPSRRAGRWREQIGLPIVEGLASGLTIVTSRDTGLAAWLEAQGHQVIRSDYQVVELAGALLEALGSPIPKKTVIGSLPLEPQRIRADRWLHESGAS
ncbi:glycosyltransferase [Aeromicrobium yanjiei]|uniref:Glycosyltransferase n=1 Tax=Aeromicrobium yanjiei TaxID=2662028 RepID=A0A5Q2MG60_9ACTN|nr:glycosyltransferase [Aeromicrobium yanjiei]QGG40032.1 glycosyltransferase [Aeromicrobium yanjiei]